MNVTDLLNDREKKYGDFGELAKAIQAYKSAARHAPRWNAMTSSQREAVEMIVMKLCRVLYGDPMHMDSWVDISGYAVLAAEEFNPRTEGGKPEPMVPAANPATPAELENAVAK